MNAKEELVFRLAQRRRQAEQLSDAAFEELVIAVRKNPDNFIEDVSDQAFQQLVFALDRYDASCEDDELLDDGQFLQKRSQRFARLRRDCTEALKLDENCFDARLLDAIAADYDPDVLVNVLLGLVKEAKQKLGVDTDKDCWDNVFTRPYMRIGSVLTRTLLDSARYRMARDQADYMMSLNPADVLGCRHSAALACARLEDEAGLDALDARFERRGNSWMQLSYLILFYKLGRMGAARRALSGLERLCEGGAYALLRPILIDSYMPDRPLAATYSFEEVTLAVHEADSIIVDVPDFPEWAQEQGDFLNAALSFAHKSDLDW